MAVAARRVDPFGTTIFTEINQLALETGAINLGQGKPDWEPPAQIVEDLARAARDGGQNQYAPGPGTVALRRAVADHARRFYDLAIDPTAGVVITAGATEGIFAAVLGLTDPGDEVIVIEPFYDSYVPNILMAGGIPACVPLHGPDWTLDMDELRAAVTPRTRAIILNTPHNPTGRVFSRAELEEIAAICQEFDLTVIADEVYDHLLYDDARHIPMASLPGMFARTVTVGSAGKLFSATGWKVGWVQGPVDLIAGVGRAHQFITFAVHHPSQVAIAAALQMPDSYFIDYQAMYATKRQILLDGLLAAGFTCRVPQGAYYLLADYGRHFSGPPDAFARELIARTGVAAIPPTAFYSAEHAALAGTTIRFAFCKGNEVLSLAGERLRRLAE